MALVSSLFTAISGLRNHQTLLDVISNNVSNVNTIGFKAGRVQFRDLLSQTVSSPFGADAANGRGGVNGVQIGSGVSVAAVDTLHTQGTLQATGVATDMAINGDGYFVVKQGAQTLYTRAGSFRFDTQGNLVNSSGALVQGWSATVQTTINAATGTTVVDPFAKLAIDASNPQAIATINIPSTTTMKANETTLVELQGNLDAGATAANLVNSAGMAGTTTLNPAGTAITVGQHKINFTVYDSLGNAHGMIATFTNLSDTPIPGAGGGPVGTNYEANTWRWEVTTDPNDTTVALLPDNIAYTDPITGQVIRASHSGIMHYTTTGGLDYVTYGDTNENASLTANWDASGTLEDGDMHSIIGFEGAGIVAAGDSGTGGNSYAVTPAPFALGIFDNPNGISDELTNLAAPGIDLSKLPIVLQFLTPQTNQAVVGLPGVQPPAGAGTTPGRLVDLSTAYGQFNPTATTPGTAYVQAFNIDWGTVSTITNADFDNYADTPGGGLVELGAPNGDGQRDQASDASGFYDGAAPVSVRSLSDGLRDGLTQDVGGTWQVINGLNTYVPRYTAIMRAQDGFTSGTLQSLSVDATGNVVGAFSNGQTQELAQVAMAAFQNPSGLSKVGDAHFAATINSGNADIGTALTSTRGAVVGGVLEQSNVDLSQELTNMIVAQRGFEANARLITTSDRILDTLVNLGR